jgi:N-acetylneuraminic acid mutarotase
LLSWSTSVPLPLPRAGRPAVAAVNGKIYVIGGNDGSSIVNTTYIFDPTAGTWTLGSPMPAGRQNTAVAVVNGFIHVIGGANPAGTPHTDHFVYNPASNSWVTEAPLPVATTQASAVAYGSLIYFTGGGLAGVGAGPGVGANVTSATYMFDDTSNTWATKASMPTARALFGIAIYGQSIYVIGGHGNGSTIYATNEVYDIPSNTWSTQALMPTARNGMMAAIVNNKIYMIGGSPISNPGSGSSALATNEEYDPQLSVWYTRAPMPTPRFDGGAAVVNNLIYVIGGSNGSSTFATNEVYNPSLDGNP